MERAGNWKNLGVALGGAAVCLALVWGGLRFPELISTPGLSAAFPFSGTREEGPVLHPFVELLKLVTSAAIGMIVTAVHKRVHHDHPLSRSMQQAQVLLCVSGAMMMIIIGNSVARALGIAGGAGIIRFRTPVEDPKDAILLVLMLGLGMSCGLGAFAVAGLGTVFLCLFLLVLDHVGEGKPRSMFLELIANGPEFPTSHVQSVFAQHGIAFEPRGVSQGAEAKVKYHVSLAPDISLEDLSSKFMNGGSSGIRSVNWEAPKKKELTDGF